MHLLIRSRLAADLAYLGVAIDGEANDAANADAEITAPTAPVRALVITAREDLEVVRQVRQMLERP